MSSHTQRVSPAPLVGQQHSIFTYCKEEDVRLGRGDHEWRSEADYKGQEAHQKVAVALVRCVDFLNKTNGISRDKVGHDVERALRILADDPP